MAAESISIGRGPSEPVEPVDPAGAPTNPWREDAPDSPEPVTGLPATGAKLLDQARQDARGRATMMLHKTDAQRAMLIALTEGNGLPEHEAPPSATLQGIIGRAKLHAGDRDWTLEAGDLVPIPQERHGVDALEDCVVLLTVSLEPRGG